MSADRTSAQEACNYVMGRIIRDGRIAYLMGPGTEAWSLVTAAVAEMRGQTPDEYRAYIMPSIRCEPIIERSSYDALRAELDA